MSFFKKLVVRGSAVMREWLSYEDVDDGSRMMLAAVAASTMTTMCGEQMNSWTQQEKEEKALAMRVALTSAYQIGRATAPHKKVRRSP
jgi:hypothetical protein